MCSLSQARFGYLIVCFAAKLKWGATADLDVWKSSSTCQSWLRPRVRTMCLPWLSLVGPCCRSCHGRSPGFLLMPLARKRCKVTSICTLTYTCCAQALSVCLSVCLLLLSVSLSLSLSLCPLSLSLSLLLQNAQALIRCIVLLVAPEAPKCIGGSTFATSLSNCLRGGAGNRPATYPVSLERGCGTLAQGRA